jgi:predicted GIY-YIG superfamily endonuclease
MVAAYVYVLRSEKTGKQYVGSTELKPEERLRQHNAGTMPWTKGHTPLRLVYSETFPSAILAQRRERFFKTGKSRTVLKSLLSDFSPG